MGQEKKIYLECEKPWVYRMLIFAAGWFGAYTFILRGGVFCNAQTANVVLLAVALGQKDWSHAGYLLIPITAYFAGAFVSEMLGRSVKRLRFLRWDTALIGFEILVVVFLGFLPGRAPDQICQIALNFICSMQFNTFRQVEGTPAATTFVTAHIRQVGHYAARYLHHPEPARLKKLWLHSSLILCFAGGGVAGAVCCGLFSFRSIWGSGVIMLFIFLRLAYADMTYEKDYLDQVPHGH